MQFIMCVNIIKNIYGIITGVMGLTAGKSCRFQNITYTAFEDSASNVMNITDIICETMSSEWCANGVQGFALPDDTSNPQIDAWKDCYIPSFTSTSSYSSYYPQAQVPYFDWSFDETEEKIHTNSMWILFLCGFGLVGQCMWACGMAMNDTSGKNPNCSKAQQKNLFIGANAMISLLDVPSGILSLLIISYKFTSSLSTWLNIGNILFSIYSGCSAGKYFPGCPCYGVCADDSIEVMAQLELERRDMTEMGIPRRD